MRHLTAGVALPIIATLTACAAVGPDYQAPANEFISEPALVGDQAVTSDPAEPANTWWLSLADPALNKLVDTALVANRDLQVAVANVDAARALLRLERTNLRPQGEVTGAVQRRQVGGAALGLNNSSVNDSDYLSAGIAATWELDFFGRVRRATEAARADAERAEALRRYAQVLVIAETVRAYTDFRGAQVQLAVATRNLALQNDTLQLTRIRLNEGMGSQLDVARAETLAKTTESTLPPLQAARIAAANRLATLTGSSVSTVEQTLDTHGEEPSLPSPPALLAVGDVATLIERRADVTAAERELAAATARIGLAKADYFPRITLAGDVSTSAQAFSNLNESAALGYSIGPQLSWSGFDVPRVKATVNAAGARSRAALAAYEQTVLVAIEEVQTALAAYGRERVRFEALVVAAAKARDAAGLARLRYDGGVDDFLTVLDADRSALDAESAREQSRTAVTTSYAILFRALGAGWEHQDGDLLQAR